MGVTVSPWCIGPLMGLLFHDVARGPLMGVTVSPQCMGPLMGLLFHNVASSPLMESLPGREIMHSYCAMYTYMVTS